MSLKALASGVEFRPHFKTHQSLEIGRWFKEKGVQKITVSSLTMAEYFSSEWNDITVAFPTNILEIDTINRLAKRITLNLSIENEESVRFLVNELQAPVQIYLKIDMGYHRTGIEPHNRQLIDKILETIDSSDLVHFKGFLGHAGHTYSCTNTEEVMAVYRESMTIVSELKGGYSNRYPDVVFSIGDTPGCSVVEDFSWVDEIRPGNFVFYDLTQHKIGSNSIAQIAVALACPITAIHKHRNEIVVYGGGVHFSKERLEDDEGTIFGRVVEKHGNGWGRLIPNMYLKSLSQDPGILSVPENRIDQYGIGDYVLILPVHSCMTANLMRVYQTLEGEQISVLS